jgi:hypothetical protein
MGLNSKITWACLLTACLLLISPLSDIFFYPNSVCNFPRTDDDTALYKAIMQKFSIGQTKGESFIWEHRFSEKAATSLLSLWLRLYGFLYGLGGDGLLLIISVGMSFLWFYLMMRFCMSLGQSPRFAFFSAGLQCFLVINFAYQLIGYKSNWRLYNLWVSEHMRLYPSVTAMVFYTLSIYSFTSIFLSSSKLRLLGISVLIALVAYGRPYDWLVILGALSLFFVFLFVLKERVISSKAFIVLALSITLSIPFAYRYFSYQRLYHDAFIDQIARGLLKAKHADHYVKYLILCFFCFALLVLLYRKTWRQIFIKLKDGISLDSSEYTWIWMVCLFVSGLLGHLKTFFEGGLTLNGFQFFMVFSTIPWGYQLLMHRWWQAGVNRTFEKICPWIIVSFVFIQQIGCSLHLPPLNQGLVKSERLNVYRWISKNNSQPPVVLTLGRGVEMATLGNAWVFFPNTVVASYYCAAPTSELLDRFLLGKLMLTGTISDLAPLFSPEGIKDYDEWFSIQPKMTQTWVKMMVENLGHNTFIIHPLMNRGDLVIRKLQLPPNLVHQEQFVAYFTEEFRNVYDRCSLLEKTHSPDQILEAVRSKYRLDYVYIPEEMMVYSPNVSTILSDAQKIAPSSAFDGNLWKITNKD